MSTQIISMVSKATETVCYRELPRTLLLKIKNGAWKAQVESVRAALATQGKDAANALKLGLPAVMFSGKFSKRKATALEQHSGLVCADLDNAGDNPAAVLDQIATDPHCAYTFISPSGTGVKALFRCDPARPHA